MTLDVLPKAQTDIRKAYNHLRSDNVAIANRFLDVLDNAYDLIERNPNVGRPVKGRNVREWSVPNWPYLIPYRVMGKDVEILRIWHTRKDRPDRW